MATTLTTAARNAAANAVVDLLDVGSANASAQISIRAANGTTVVALLPMSATAFGNASTGVCTAAAITDDTNAAGGTAAIAVFEDQDEAEVFRCAVGTSGSDINFSTVSIGAGDTVSITSLTYTQPA